MIRFSWLALLEEAHHTGDFLPGIDGRLFIRGQVRAQRIVERDHPSRPEAGGIRHGKHIGLGRLCRSLRRIEFDPYAFVGRKSPRNANDRSVGINPGETRRAAGRDHLLRNPGPDAIRNAHNGRVRCPPHLGVSVARDYSDAGVCGRVTVHGHGGKTRRLSGREGGCPVRLPFNHADELKPGLQAFFNQRLERLLLFGISRQARGPTDHKAIDRRTLYDCQCGRIKPSAKHLCCIRREALLVLAACDIQWACWPSHRYGLCVQGHARMPPISSVEAVDSTEISVWIPG